MKPWVERSGRPESDTRKQPVELRECRHHGLTKFGRHKAGRGQIVWRCRRCVADAVTRRHHRVRRILIEEAGGRCAVCGYDRCIVALHFHHVDPSTKEFALTSARGKGIEARRREARKCVLVCANCHGEIEAGLIESPPAGATYEDLRLGRSGGGPTT